MYYTHVRVRPDIEDLENQDEIIRGRGGRGGRGGFRGGRGGRGSVGRGMHRGNFRGRTFDNVELKNGQMYNPYVMFDDLVIDEVQNTF